ncbi:hypothetical protein MINTM021_17500 [Mycobacterium paraintracellulare]|nr:hypothetical protein MINTM021_17500 [Mycobacterium paraintracellulare]
MSRLGRGFPNNQLMRQVPILAAPPVFDSAGTGGNLNTASLSITTVSPNTYVIVDVQTDRAATIGTPTIDSVAMTKLASSGWTARFGLAVAASGSHSIAAGTGTAWDASAAVAYTNVARVVSTVTGPTSVTLAAGQLALMAWGGGGAAASTYPGTRRATSQDQGYCHVVESETTLSMSLSPAPTFLTVLSSR